MKSTLIFAAIACALGVTFAAESEKVEHAIAEVADYIREQWIQFPMGRSIMDHSACYANLTQQINNLTKEANVKSEDCVKTSALQKASTLTVLNQSRSQMVANVAKLTSSFFECGKKTSPLDYFQCLRTNIEGNADLMKGIRDNSQQLADHHENGMKKIETDEKTCLAGAVDESKSKAGEAFERLRACLGQGDADGTKAPPAA